jgi:hypothetical protein
MQYFGTWITAARVAVLCSYPQISAEHRDQLPPCACAVASLIQLQPAGQVCAGVGVVVIVPCRKQYAFICAAPVTAEAQGESEHRVNTPNLSFAADSTMQEQPAGHTAGVGVSTFFTQYSGIRTTAATVAVLCLYPQTASEYLV